MTNIEAAIGLAQIERLDATLARKREIASFYRTKLSGLPLTFPQVPKKVKSSEWLVSFLLPDGVSRDAVMDFLAQRGIETRPVFHCAHQMPMYNQSARRFPVSETIAARGISLPSYPSLTEHDLNRVCKALEESLKI